MGHAYTDIWLSSQEWGLLSWLYSSFYSLRMAGAHLLGPVLLCRAIETQLVIWPCSTWCWGQWSQGHHKDRWAMQGPSGGQNNKNIGSQQSLNWLKNRWDSQALKILKTSLCSISCWPSFLLNRWLPALVPLSISLLILSFSLPPTIFRVESWAGAGWGFSSRPCINDITIFFSLERSGWCSSHNDQWEIKCVVILALAYLLLGASHA